jgi:hypothetical protein
MDPKVMWMIGTIAVLGVATVLRFVIRKRRTEHLRQRFGPEYDRAVNEKGDVRHAESTLEARAKRVERLHLKPLSADEAARFAAAWLRIQSNFVDDPKQAVSEADRVVGEVMAARGYPLGDFEQRAADISVDHANVVTNYRAARNIGQRHAIGEASTEDLRQAMVHYRALFDDLLETTPAPDARHETVARDAELAEGRR